VRKNIRNAIRRPELLAVLSLATILIAGVLTKTGRAWCGVVLMIALFLLGIVIEQPLSVPRIGRALDRPRQLIKSARPTSDQASISAAQTVQA
jgi:hypothetical protein